MIQTRLVVNTIARPLGRRGLTLPLQSDLCQVQPFLMPQQHLEQYIPCDSVPMYHCCTCIFWGGGYQKISRICPKNPLCCFLLERRRSSIQLRLCKLTLSTSTSKFRYLTFAQRMRVYLFLISAHNIHNRYRNNKHFDMYQSSSYQYYRLRRALFYGGESFFCFGNVAYTFR